jgi:hypothetical protein
MGTPHPVLEVTGQDPESLLLRGHPRTVTPWRSGRTPHTEGVRAE